MNLKRTLAILLTLAMLLSNLPVFGLADDAVTEPQCTCAQDPHTADCDITKSSTPAPAATDPTETTAETTTAASEPAPEVCGNCEKDPCICCTECGAQGGHIVSCSQYVNPEEPTCSCGTESDVHAESCPKYIKAEAEKDLPLGEGDTSEDVTEEGSAGFGWDIFEEEEQYTTEELYEAIFKETTLRGLFNLVNANINALLGFDLEQILEFEFLIYDIQATSSMDEDEASALKELEDNVLALKERWSCPECSELNGQHSSACKYYEGFTLTPYNIAAPTNETVVGDSHFSKKLIEDDSQNKAIRIEAWVEGSSVSTPTDIVVALDHSASVYTAMNRDEDHVWSWEEFQQKADKEKASKFQGYYVVVNKFNGSTTTDLNDYTIKQGDPCYALVRWNKRANNGAGQWERCYLMKIGQWEYDGCRIDTSFGNNSRIIRSQQQLADNIDWYAISDSDGRGFTKGNAKYFQSIYGATVDALDEFINQIKNIPDCRIAFTGFAGNGTPGTGLFVNQVLQRRITPSGVYPLGNDHLRTALFDASNTTLLENVINNYIPIYGGTSTEEGIYLANQVFRVNADAADRKPNRALLLFTDGVPNNHNERDYTYPSTSAANLHYSAAVYAAHDAKSRYGATVYSVGPATAISAANEQQKHFMDYISSNYPDAKSLESPGTKMKDDCNIIADDAAGLEAAFKSLGEKIYNASMALNKNTQIRDTVTPYFDIGGGYNGGNIVVEKIPYEKYSDGTLGFNESKKETLYNESENIKLVTLIRNNGVEYDQEMDDGTTEKRKGDQIIVSNYDYGANTVYPNDGGGAKLRILIPIIPDPKFVGGNEVLTNAPGSGIYQENADRPTGEFEFPKTDVPVKDESVTGSAVSGHAGSTYLEYMTLEELEELITLKASDMTLYLNRDNYGLENWQTEYSHFKVELYNTDENGTISDTPISPEETIRIRRDHEIVAKLYIWSKHPDGDSETDQLVPPAGTIPAEARIKILVHYPTFTFADVEAYYGERIENVVVKYDGQPADQYLTWYTNAQYDASLKNVTPTVEQMKTQIAQDGKYYPVTQDQVFKDTAPQIYFGVDPVSKTTVDNFANWNIDEPMPFTGPGVAVDPSFTQEYMGKEDVAMNVRVYFNATDEDGKDDPSQGFVPIRNSFFLHAQDDKSGSDCQTITTHKSGGQRSSDEEATNELKKTYWIPEFYIHTKYCTLTITKTGGEPGETYVFDIATNAFGKEKAEYYTSASITADAKGTGTVTIYELPLGDYEITEDMEWSWRYQKQVAAVTLSKAKPDGKVVIENTKTTDQWLNGYSDVVANIFGEKKN